MEAARPCHGGSKAVTNHVSVPHARALSGHPSLGCMVAPSTPGCPPPAIQPLSEMAPPVRCLGVKKEAAVCMARPEPCASALLPLPSPVPLDACACTPHGLKSTQKVPKSDPNFVDSLIEFLRYGAGRQKHAMGLGRIRVPSTRPQVLAFGRGSYPSIPHEARNTSNVGMRTAES